MGDKYMKKYFSLFRVKHYIKNLLIFVPAFFGQTLFDLHIFKKLIIAFFCFSLAASFVYIVNDLKDCEQDKKHEIKKNRPIASGEISKFCAIICAFLSIVISVSGSLYIEKSNGSFMLLLLYIIVNCIYSLGGGKKIAVIDILMLASGFVLRVLYGASVSGTECSNWLILLVMSMSIYLGTGKRRNEMIKVNNGVTRDVLKKYTINYLDNMMKIFLTLTLVFYALWGSDFGNNARNTKLIWTLPFIITIVMKYELDIEGESYGDPVEVFLSDKVLICLVLIYVILIFGLLYVL